MNTESFKPRFLVEPGTTREATAEDETYLRRLYPLVREAARAEELLGADEVERGEEK